jgi:mono/diheme cytochrome c family protein
MSGTSPVGRTRLRRTIVGALLTLIVLFVAAVLALDVFGVGTPAMPNPQPVDKIVSLPQNWPDGWEPGQRQWFHHATQGTTIMPYEWLISLERPELKVLRTPALFITPAFMSRFGFLPGEANPQFNPEGKLPIGFAIAPRFDDPTGNLPYNDHPYRAVGLTCAACHTGRLTVTGPGGAPQDILVEGGSASINLRAFQTALGTAVTYTLFVPFRFNRFAARVLGADDTAANRAKLKAELKSWFDEARLAKEASDQRHVFSLVESGFGRTDALSLIGNRLFGPIHPGNVAVAEAPVNFPMIWDTAWFDWVQYNASIKKVMVRNIGEALGVGARTNTDPTSPRFLESTVDVANLHRLEDQLGGARPFAGLRAPKWEDAAKLAGLPPIDGALAERGKALYGTHCLHCHGPSVPELQKDLDSTTPHYWTRPAGKAPYDKPFLKTQLVELGRIGTDPAQAADFARGFALVPDPDATEASKRAAPPAHAGPPAVTDVVDSRKWIVVTVAKGLRLVTEEIRGRAYLAAGLNPAQIAEWDRFREHTTFMPDPEVILAPLGYKARPLDGIWATPPYLHNGSVPSLDVLLRPVTERPSTFHLGLTAFDPERVGFSTEGKVGSFVLDTTLPGNHNTGHEFRDLTLAELELSKKTVEPPKNPTRDEEYLNLTSKLSVDERWAKLFGLEPAEYRKLGEQERQVRRRELTVKYLSTPALSFFGVIGPALEPDERRAIIEYIKTL